jgi:hypothetical protein
MAKSEKTTETVNPNSEKLKALKLTMDKIEKDYGKGSVMMMNEKAGKPTGSYFHRFNRAGCCAWHWWSYQRKSRRNIWT